MVNIRVRDQQKNSGSPRGEVGEIDTRAPFQSVKAAVSLFGEVAVSRDRPAIRKSKLSSENVLDKETQLLLARKDIDKYKQQFESAEGTKSRALSDLERAKRTLEELTTKLETVSLSKQETIRAAEEVRKTAKQLEVAKSQKDMGYMAWKQELEQAREQYKVTAAELNAAKQELTKIRQDFDAALEAKWASFQQAAEAQRSANMNTERICELSKEISAMQNSKEQLKIASAQAHEQQTKMFAEKYARKQVCQTGKEEAEKKLESLKKEYDPEPTRKLEMKLAETSAEIEHLQEEMKKAHASEMDAVRVVTAELNEATRTLQQVAEEENSLQNSASSLRMELENVKREQAELIAKEAEKEHNASDEQSSTLEQLTSETEIARREADEMKILAQGLKQEAEIARLMSEEAEKKLELAVREAEEARAAEKRAHDEMKNLSDRQNIENHETGNQIRISIDDFESLKKKVEACEDNAEAKEADAIAQVEVLNAMNSEAEKKLEANLKAIEEIKEATEMALKSAEMAEAAQNVVEGELQRWRQKEQMMAA